MSLRSHLLTRGFGLPPAETYAIGVDKHLPITLPDGVILLADRLPPATGTPAAHADRRWLVPTLEPQSERR